MPKNQIGGTGEEIKKENSPATDAAAEKKLERPPKKKTPAKKREGIKIAPAREPAKNKKTGMVIAGGFLILLVVVVGLYIKQTVSSKTQQKELAAKIETVEEQTSAIDELKKQVEDQRQKLTEKLENVTRLWGETKQKIEEQEIRAKREQNQTAKLPALCAENPKASATASSTYPVHPRYFGLSNLGQFFTADDCGKKRNDELAAVYKNGYALGSQVELFSNAEPTAELLTAFKSLGYACAADALDNACHLWTLGNAVTSTEFIKLKPFTNLLKKETCVKC
ncbi:MAG: hypothetical protein WC862_00235 [Patescibacteria group bacterium]